MKIDLNTDYNWDNLFKREDPWNYRSEYEQLKYEHTLELIADLKIDSALEIACAEGIFTEKLAPSVGKLHAVDISATALNRAKERCKQFSNVSFAQHSLGDGIPNGDFDLIVCSEVLYYVKDQYALQQLAEYLIQAMQVNSYLIMANPRIVTDDRSITGFDFAEFGAKFIAETFTNHPGFEFLKELQTELYCIQLFRRKANTHNRAHALKTNSIPRDVIKKEHGRFDHHSIKWNGCVVTEAEAKFCFHSSTAPILMYHRIAADGPEKLAPYRVSPEAFEKQLKYLRRHGYKSVNLNQYCDHFLNQGEGNIKGRKVIFTFDDAYTDFYTTAWPLLKKHGFTATVFVPINYVNGEAEWDKDFGEPAKIMSWDQIKELHRQGVTFESHGFYHQNLRDAPTDELSKELELSKSVLEEQLNCEITGFCYPFCLQNPSIQNLVKEAGYLYAVSGDNGTSDEQYNLKRTEVFGHYSLDDFIEQLPEAELSSLSERLKFKRLRDARDTSTYTR